ncbi:MAG TPA: protein kinase [candidate division Zixibacteria bacterium]|nr:protein kinase [candidate division Zixibacteria bacterium]
MSMSPRAPAPDPLPGRLLAGRYRVEALLARGGMARVYRAQDITLDRPVAVKVLAEPYARDAAFVARFLAEARTAASFSHPNLAHVYDSGSDGDVHFIVMELLEGYRSLRDVIRERDRLPPAQAVDIVKDVLAGLAPLHARGLVHCDVKAGNVMIGPGGTRLIDFGIARPLRQASAGSTSIGSLHAMSPEQLRGDELTPASDIFATGVVLFEALTGRVPFPGETPSAVAAAHRRGPVSRPSELAPGIGPQLDAAVMQALQPEPARRFVSVEAMAAALDSALASNQPAHDDETTQVAVAPTRPPAAVARPAAARRDGSGGWALAAALLAGPALVVAIVLAGLANADRASAPPPTTPAVTQTPLPAGMVRVPDTIGLSEAEAEAAARAAGLNWRIEWIVDPAQPSGVYDQEPAPGTVVEAGSRFVMYAYRSE